MERNQAIVIAVVVAALALFGLKVWSDRSAESDLTSDSRAAAQRLARASGQGSDASGTYEGGPGRAGRPGERGALRAGDVPGSAGSRIGPDGRPVAGGSAEMARAGAPRLGGGIGVSGSNRAGGGSGSGGTITGGSGDSAGHLGPKVQQKQNLVDFLASKPPTEPDLAAPKDENGDDVALKIDKVEDIGRQGGQDQDVHKPEDGEGIEITDRGKIEFPNYASGEAATISFQIQPQWSGSDQTDNALVEIRQENEWNNALELVKNGEFLRFIIRDSTGHESDISVRIADWVAGDSHDIKASYGDNQINLYVDGRLAGTNQYPAPLQFAQGTPMYLGGDHASSNYLGAGANISNFNLSNPGKAQ